MSADWNDRASCDPVSRVVLPIGLQHTAAIQMCTFIIIIIIITMHKAAGMIILK